MDAVHTAKLTDEQLISNAAPGQSIPLEMMKRLKNSINTLNKTTSEQANTMIRLTRWLTALTIILVIGLGVQIWIALK
jgi:hypothetical protein